MTNLNFIAIDLETANYRRSSICEIGITVVKNSRIVETRNWLVRPEGNEYDDFNIMIHGITPDMTKNSPSFKEVWKDVEPYLTDQVVVAHNTAFDMYAIRDAIDEQKGMKYTPFQFYCSLRAARYTIQGCYNYTLPVVCEYVGIDMDVHHRAADDSLACAELFIKCIENAEVNSLSEFQEKYDFKCGEFTSDTYRPQLANKKYTSSSVLKSLDPVEPSNFDESNYFYGKSVCFTGTCVFGIRKDLLQKVANIGGIPTDSVTKKTDVLVVGLQDYRIVGSEGMSSKQKKAEKLIQSGQNIEILSEIEFLDLFGISESEIASIRETIKEIQESKTRTKNEDRDSMIHEAIIDLSDVLNKFFNKSGI